MPVPAAYNRPSYTFWCDVLSNLEHDEHFTADSLCSDEATYLSGHVTRHKGRIWRSGWPHAVIEVKSERPKLNVFCAVSVHTSILEFLSCRTRCDSCNLPRRSGGIPLADFGRRVL
jgi:hypothetical protein